MKTAKALFLTLALSAMATSAFAQAEKQPGKKGEQPAGERPARRGGDGAGQQQMSAEQSKAAWTMEATGAAKRLSLSDDQTKAVVAAYTAGRTDLAAKMEQARKDRQSGGGDPADAMKASQENSKAAAEKFAKALTDAKVSSEHAAKLNATLGAFHPASTRGWDMLVNTVSGFGLDAAKQQTALNAIEDFVAASGKARDGAKGDPEAARTAMQEARTKMNEALKPVLTADQMTKFEAALPGARGGGRGGDRGGDNGGGGERGPGKKGGPKPKSDK